jgi:hypothetical protein
MVCGIRYNVGRLERINVSPLSKGDAGGIQNLCGGVDASFYMSGEGDRFTSFATTYGEGFERRNV